MRNLPVTTQTTMLEAIEALDGSTDWSDADVYAKVLSAPDESDAEAGQEAQGQQGESGTGESQAASSATPAAADNAPGNQEEGAAGVATRDGKHVIPFSVLEAARAQAKALEQANLALQQQLAAKEAPPKSTEAVGLTDEELADLADIPQVGKLNAVVKQLAAKLDTVSAQAAAPAAQHAAAGALTPEQIEQDAFDAGIAANPLIADWMAKPDSREWARAAQLDTVLKNDPANAALSYADRFAKVQRMVAAEFDIPLPVAKTTQQRGGPAAAASATQHQIHAAPDPSLDELGAVTPSVDADRWASMQTRDMRAALDGLSDDQIRAMVGVTS